MKGNGNVEYKKEQALRGTIACPLDAF